MSRFKTIGYSRDWIYNQPGGAPFDTNISGYDTEYMFSLSNASSRVNGVYTAGSNFMLWKSGFDRSTSDPQKCFRNGSWTTPAYEGSFVAPIPGAIPFPLYPALEGYGPNLYNRAKPDKPLMGLANAIYELKDVPDMLKHAFEVKRTWRNQVKSLKDISNFNLAVNFGWLPLLSDCRNLWDTASKLDKRIKQLLRDNGRPVRRQFVAHDLSNDSEHTVMEYEVPFSELQPTLLTQCYAGSGRSVLKHKTSTKVWFSGKFRFWLPDQGNLTDTQFSAVIARRLYGVRPTPIVIYRAIPWSWLADWIGNVGDNVANLDSDVAERLVSDYAYLMRTIRVEAELSCTAQIRTGPDRSTVVTGTTTSWHVRKERVAGSPFGFQFRHEDLTPFQSNIIASLAGKRVNRNWSE